MESAFKFPPGRIIMISVVEEGRSGEWLVCLRLLGLKTEPFQRQGGRAYQTQTLTLVHGAPTNKWGLCHCRHTDNVHGLL